MQRTLRHFIIQLLVAALVSLGIAQAGGDLCPPDCSHCGAVATVSSCCDDMSVDEAAVHVPVKPTYGPGCGHGSYCESIESKNDAISVHRAVGQDLAFITSAATVVLPEPKFSVRYSSFSSTSPVPGRQPALYTLHCSLLI